MASVDPLVPDNRSIVAGTMFREVVLRETFVAHAELHARLTSTNDRAAEAASERLSLPLLVVAEEQTDGRGRGSNRWWTGRDSLAMSLAIGPMSHGLSPTLLRLLSLAAAVAVVETARPYLPNESLGLHWPNDVYAKGRKLSGILVECPKPELAVIGVGVNTNTSFADAPHDVQRRATSLRELTGQRLDQTRFLIGLLQRLEASLKHLATDAESFGRQFDRLCLQHGQTITVRMGNELVTGRCERIAPDGALVLITAEGPRNIYSGALVHEGGE